MDALVEQIVFGNPTVLLNGDHWRAKYLRGDPGSSLQEYQLYPLPEYSRLIAAAWEVVEKTNLIVGKSGGEWSAQDGWDCEHYAEFADTAPLAICRTALLVAIKL